MDVNPITTMTNMSAHTTPKPTLSRVLTFQAEIFIGILQEQEHDHLAALHHRNAY
jgi:hypothetical protein